VYISRQNDKKIMKYLFARTILTLLMLMALCACSANSSKESAESLALARIEAQLKTNQHRIETAAVGIEMLKANQDTLDSSLLELQLAVDELNSSADQPEPVLVQVDEQTIENQSAGGDQNQEEPKMVLGRAEWVWLESNQYYVKAYTDSSVEYSLILAEELVVFERDGNKWVRATIDIGDETSKIEAPVLQNSRFTTYSHKTSRRGPVISLMLRLGNFEGDINFIVVERKKTAYPLTLGRNFLTDIAVVDVSKKFVQKRDRALQDIQNSSGAQ
jgi:hypothetical protein